MNDYNQTILNQSGSTQLPSYTTAMAGLPGAYPQITDSHQSNLTPGQLASNLSNLSLQNNSQQNTIGMQNQQMHFMNQAALQTNFMNQQQHQQMNSFQPQLQPQFTQISQPSKF